MRDRLSTKILSNGATRYGVYDETGNLLRYEYIKLEDEPTVEGDLFSKANMLPDSIPAALGLKMSNPQVKDALNVLANIGNVHVWQRVQTYADPVPEVPAGYTLGEVNNNVPIVTLNDGYNYLTEIYITVAAALSVTQDGNISLSNATTNRYNLVAWTERDDTLALLAGNFVMIEESSEYNTPYLNTILFVPADATITGDKDRTITLTKVQSVTGYPYTPAIPAGTHTDYLTSTDRNAYPDQSSDGSSYLLGESESKQVSEYYDTGTTRYLNLSYSDSVVISGDGSSVELNNPTTVKIGANASANFNVAKGKFCKFFQTSDTSVTVSITDLVFIPSDAEFSLTYPNSRYTVTCSKVQSVTVVPCTITYLGQLGEAGARIEVVSYVGTGTYGADNPVTIKFDIIPKILFISCAQSDDDANVASGNGGWVRTSSFSGTTARPGSVTFDGKNVSLYAPSKNSSYDARSSYNYSGWEYTAIAIS